MHIFLLATTISGALFSPVIHADINTLGQVSKSNASVTASDTHYSHFNLSSPVGPNVAPLHAEDLKSIIIVHSPTVSISCAVDHAISCHLSLVGSAQIFSEKMPSQMELFRHEPPVSKWDIQLPTTCEPAELGYCLVSIKRYVADVTTCLSNLATEQNFR